MVMKKSNLLFPLCPHIHAQTHIKRKKNNVASYFEDAEVLFSTLGLTFSVCVCVYICVSLDCVRTVTFTLALAMSPNQAAVCLSLSVQLSVTK